ncbi:MAG: hypothetical protein H7832_00755 [Magnetococcus sp. DMHC-6]
MSCTPSWMVRWQEASELAQHSGFSSVEWETGFFHLRGFLRILKEPSDLLVVYIEGDGRAWLNQRTPSKNPSPTNPIALKLALQDPSSKVLYVSRPCQFVDNISKECDVRYWTSHRYSQEVIVAMARVIDVVKAQTKTDSIALVGYSGGGTVATLIARERKDIAWLLTIAANLDVAMWTKWHGVSSMPDSLDPAEDTSTLQHIPQIHFIGAQDRIVPPEVTYAFQNKFADPKTISVRVIASFDHQCCWVKEWPRILSKIHANFDLIKNFKN